MTGRENPFGRVRIDTWITVVSFVVVAAVSWGQFSRHMEDFEAEMRSRLDRLEATMDAYEARERVMEGRLSSLEAKVDILLSRTAPAPGGNP